MPIGSLPMPAVELGRRLSRTLAPRRDGLQLSVADPELIETPTNFGLMVKVTVTTDGMPGADSWRVTVPLDPLDLDPAVDPASFVTTIRANLEEWWDMKGVEPLIAAWGHHLD